MTESQLFPDKRINICKPCIKDMVNVEDIESVKSVLRAIDKPFLDFIWIKCLDTLNPLGNYLRQLSSLHQYKGMTWNDTQDSGQEMKSPLRVKNSKEQKVEVVQEEVIPENLRKKWGREFSSIEILEFEDLYGEWKNNYQIKTPMHETFLKHAVIASVKATKAIAKGDSREAEQYTKIFKEMTAAGKLQPATMSRAELDGGLSTFSELVRQVEKAVDIIPILPQFKERPADKVDFAIWQYINYSRDLQGLPLVDHKDIYAFIEERIKDYENENTETTLEEIEETTEEMEEES